MLINTNFMFINYLKEVKPVISDPEFETLTEIHHGVRVTDICWSPQTDLQGVPKVVRYVCILILRLTVRT